MATDTLRAKPEIVFGKAYNFRLRQHKKGPFIGLWELAIVDTNNNVKKMISDADALNFCMENMMGELENDGF